MDLLSEYRAKLRTADEAVKIVKNGDWVDYGSNNSYPAALDAALARRRDELRAVKVRGNLLQGPLAVVECKRPDVKIDAAVAEQALRYHAVQNVKFIFLTNGTSTYIYRKEDAGFTPLGHFPTYQEMNTECPL